MIDVTSPTWHYVHALMKGEEQTLIRQLRSPDNTLSQDQYIKGQLYTIERILGIPEQQRRQQEAVERERRETFQRTHGRSARITDIPTGE